MKATKPKPTAFSARLRQLREAAGLSPEALGEKTGVHAQIVRKLEAGQSRWPRLDTAVRLARGLGVGVEALADGLV